VQQAGEHRTGHQEAGQQQARPVALLRRALRMIADSGVPSIHSVISTWSVPSTTPGTSTSGSPSYASWKVRWASASSR
jgi:hypothetical protein